MSPLRHNPVPNATRADGIRDKLCQVERRQWWLWSFAGLVTLLLLFSVASLTFPAFLTQGLFSFSFSRTVRTLLGLLLLFGFYVLCQHFQIHRIQRQLSHQIDALGRLEADTGELYKLATLDALTGLYNRRAVEQRLAEEISRCLRHFAPLTVLLIDLDGLKSVNDTFGHAAGDDLIKHFAKSLRTSIRGYDVAARLGGDEFLIVLPECKPDGVPHILERLMGLQLDHGGKTIPISFSTGWARYQPGELLEEFLKRADDALYADKRGHKNILQVKADK